MKNEYGAKLDANGYARSLLEQDDDCCWYCGCGGDLARHEAFEGTGRRQKSKRLGLWVRICPVCHRECHAHERSGPALRLKQDAEIAAMQHYGWDRERFIAEFGENYLEDETC